MLNLYRLRQRNGCAEFSSGVKGRGRTCERGGGRAGGWGRNLPPCPRAWSCPRTTDNNSIYGCYHCWCLNAVHTSRDCVAAGGHCKASAQWANHRLYRGVPTRQWIH